MITVTPVNPQTVTINGKSVSVATTFRVGYPQQELSGTYTVQIGPDASTGQFPVDENGDAVDSALQAGLDVLRGGTSTDPVTTVLYTSSDLPKVISPSVGTSSPPVTSTIIVPDNFTVQGDTTSSGVSGLRVTVNLTYPNDPDLTLTSRTFRLEREPDGNRTPGHRRGQRKQSDGEFHQHGLRRQRDDPDPERRSAVQSRRSILRCRCRPLQGMSAQGSWVLVVQNSGGSSGTINSWSLTFQKPLPTSGLGVPGADNINASFRLFNLGQADAMSAQAWTPVGAASIAPSGTSTSSTGGSAENTTANRSGRVTGLAIDPSDPTGNTVYAAGASGGVWKTTDFLTTNPAGPTWISLTDFGPSNAVNIGSITVFPMNNNVNQTVIIAATGEGNTGTPGVGFLISTNGGATWTLDDSSVNVDSSGNPLPIETNIPSLERNRTFVGDTAYQVVVDPKLSPSGQVIIYAALSGPTGGVWRSLDSGQHWTNMLPGQATSVVLDADSGAVLNSDTGTTTRQPPDRLCRHPGRGCRDEPQPGPDLDPDERRRWQPADRQRIQYAATNVNPTAGPTPNGAEGRIVLAVPNATGNAAEDPIYEGWLYAAVANPAGGFFGLFVTKDFGQNWTDVPISSLPAVSTNAQAIPTNDVTQPNYPITGGGQFTAQGNYDLILVADPTNPNVVYLGGSRRRRPDCAGPRRYHEHLGRPLAGSPIPASPATAVRSICPRPARPPSPIS